MAWTYSGNPSASGLDKVRFLIQDTDSADQQLSDAEIKSMLTDASQNAYIAAIKCCQALVSKYTRRADKSVGDLSISFSQISKGYASLISTLREQASTSGSLAPAYAGGISRSDKLIDETDTDLVKPSFRKGMNDYQGQFTSVSDDDTEQV